MSFLDLLNRFADGNLRKLYAEAKGDRMTAESRLAVANHEIARKNAALAECERKADQAAETAKRTYEAQKDHYQRLVESIKEAHLLQTDRLGAYIADLNVRLERASEYADELEERLRKADQHIDMCARADAIAEDAAAKRKGDQ